MLWSHKVKTEVNTFTLTMIVVGLFGGMGALFYFGGLTFIRIDTIFNIVIITGAVVFLIHLPFLKKMNRFLAEVVIYSLVGWGLLLSGIFLALNYYIHSSVDTDTYQVETAIAHPEDRTLPFPITVTLSNSGTDKVNVPASNYNDFGYLLKFEGEEEIKSQDKPAAAIITTAKGLFGYRVMIHKELR